MSKRISDLVATSNLEPGDLFLMTDVLNNQSKKITFSDLDAEVFGPTVFTSTGRQALLVSALNSYNPGGVGTNTLRATQLYAGSGASLGYKDGSYFLDYRNLTNKPTIGTSLSDFTNATGFVRLDNTNTFKLIYDGTGRYDITSDNILEGQTNKFYSDVRTDARINQLFGSLFNSYNGTFDDGEDRDSLSNVPGGFINIDSVGNSSTIAISNMNLRPSFAEGQTIRLYGASPGNAVFNISTQLTLTKSGLAYTQVGNVLAVNTTISYRVADFNIETGEISAASAVTGATSVAVSVPLSTDLANSLGEAFNSTNFIRLNLSNTLARRGVAVYRQIGTGTAYKLIAVLGTKEVQAGSWIDYYNFDYSEWSGKSSADNSYTDIVHFPLTPPSTQRRGWVDRSIRSITNLPASFNITLNEQVYTNTPVGGVAAVSVFHNDTAVINNAILANSIVGKKSIVLNSKTYNSAQIRVPNNFGITGTAYISQIKKLPWTGGETGTENGKFITANQGTNATGISLIGIDINGNIANQFLFPDRTTPNANYLVDFGAQSNSVLIDKVRITNSPAGGIWATSPSALKITTSEVINSCLTDRYSYSPLIADDGDTTMVVANKFENYSRLVDVSVTNKGVFVNNIVSNCGDEFGYGVYVYGSTFFLSSPNVLIGPSGEFIATPDTLNSEYDLINVDISEARASNDDYESPVHVYQENGATYDLTQTDGSASSIEYRAFYLQRNAQGVEEVYGTTYTPSQFTPGKRYTIVSLGTTTQTQWNTAAGGVAGREYVVGSSFICAAAVPSGGTGTATSGAVDAITLNPIVGNLNRALGQFAFSIPAPIVNQIKTAGGAYSSSTLRGLNPLHQGIGWSASYRHEVKAADIPGAAPGTWSVDPAGISPTYTVTVENVNYLGVGKWVKVLRPSWANPRGVLEGRITAISTTANQSLVTIVFPGAGGGISSDPAAMITAGLINGSGIGQLNITDTFVMAQGRII
jgi:hypothetical protein